MFRAMFVVLFWENWGWPRWKWWVIGPDKEEGSVCRPRCPDSTQDFLSISFSTRIQMGPTSSICHFGMIWDGSRWDQQAGGKLRNRNCGMTWDGCCSSRQGGPNLQRKKLSQPDSSGCSFPPESWELLPPPPSPPNQPHPLYLFAVVEGGRCGTHLSAPGNLPTLSALSFFSWGSFNGHNSEEEEHTNVCTMHLSFG